MSIEREGKFWVETDVAGRVLIGIDSKKIPACIAEVTRRKAQGVFGNPGFGFKENNLDFLAKLPAIHKVHFWEVKIKDINGIYALRTLKYFCVQPKRPAVDFARLPRLEEIMWDYNEGDTGLASLGHVRLLYLSHYNPKYASFDGLELPKSIEDLAIVWANPKTLAGIPQMPLLKKLEIARCRNLESLKGLPDIAPNLEHLVVESCDRVADGEEVVPQLRKIRHAYVRDRVILSLPDLPETGIRRADA